MLLGGVPNLPENFPITHRDFVGCMRDLFIDSKRIDLASYIANNGTTAGTRASAPASPCPGNGFSFSTALVLGCNSITAPQLELCKFSLENKALSSP